MKLRVNRIIPAALIAAFAMVAGSAAYAQGTPDGETPANEDVCDELIESTPGLYGLCVAFCEAQDCEATFDPDSGEVTFDPDCKPSSAKLLANYNKRMAPDDPSMPCVNVVLGGCPCWTEDELDLVADAPSPMCFLFPASSNLFGLDEETGTPDIVQATPGEDDMSAQCFYLESSPAASHRMDISSAQFTDCEASIIAECASRGL